MYTYNTTHVCVYIYIYIYTHVYRPEGRLLLHHLQRRLPKQKERERERESATTHHGSDGCSTKGEREREREIVISIIAIINHNNVEIKHRRACKQVLHRRVSTLEEPSAVHVRPPPRRVFRV